MLSRASLVDVGGRFLVPVEGCSRRAGAYDIYVRDDVETLKARYLEVCDRLSDVVEELAAAYAAIERSGDAARPLSE